MGACASLAPGCSLSLQTRSAPCVKLGGPVILETLATDLEKSHPIEDPGLPLASLSTATDDKISSSRMGPPLFS